LRNFVTEVSLLELSRNLVTEVSFGALRNFVTEVSLLESRNLVTVTSLDF